MAIVIHDCSDDVLTLPEYELTPLGDRTIVVYVVTERYGREFMDRLWFATVAEKKTRKSAADFFRGRSAGSHRTGSPVGNCPVPNLQANLPSTRVAPASQSVANFETSSSSPSPSPASTCLSRTHGSHPIPLRAKQSCDAQRRCEA